MQTDSSHPPGGTSEPYLVDVTQQTTAVIRGSVPMAELPAFYDRSFPTIATVLQRQGVTVVGAAFAAYDGPPTEPLELTVGFMTDGVVRPEDGVVADTLPPGRVARLVHCGGYDELEGAWGQLGAWIEAAGYTAGAVGWEVYLTEPTPDVDPRDLRTELNWLLTE